MSRGASTKRSPTGAKSPPDAVTVTAKTSERTPLLNSVGMEESLVNKNVSEMQPGVSWGVAAFLLVNTALGAGMLNYPYAYNQIGGVITAALMQIVLLFFITSTMFILVYCADFNQDDTYHDVLLSMCGKRAQQISAISILLTCYGINITFLVIIGDQYDRIFNSLLAEHMEDWWFLNRKFTISLTAILFIWPMCYAKRLDFLRHASVLGMCAMLYVAFLTVYEHFVLDEATIAATLSQHSIETMKLEASTNSSSTSPGMMAANKSVRWFEPLAIVPILCFAYQTHEVIVPVYACMKQRSIGHFMKASIFGLVILFFLYNLVGAFGYLTFGENVGPDIISLYDAKDPIVVVGVVALVIKFITTYPPLMFCGRGALDGLYGEIRKLSTEEFKSTERFRRIVITTLWFVTTVALAVFAPDISLTLQLLGSMASINVFVFPGMCLVSLTRRLRRARLGLLMAEAYDQPGNQQRAKDYYLISGSCFVRKTAHRADNSLMHQQSVCNSNRQTFAATFASLLEFENNASSQFGEYSNMNGNSIAHQQQKLNGYGTQFRQQKRQEEFERLITNGSYSNQDPVGRPINDSFDDYSDCEQHHHRSMNNHKSDYINSLVTTSNKYQLTESLNLASRKAAAPDFDLNASSHNKDLSIDGSATCANRNPNQCLQNSWHNRSTTGSILDRLGSSIAPSTVGQIGISSYTAFALYLFAALLLAFGTFIFVLELVDVFGFL